MFLLLLLPSFRSLLFFSPLSPCSRSILLGFSNEIKLSNTDTLYNGSNYNISNVLEFVRVYAFFFALLSPFLSAVRVRARSRLCVFCMMKLFFALGRAHSERAYIVVSDISSNDRTKRHTSKQKSVILALSIQPLVR